MEIRRKALEQHNTNQLIIFVSVNLRGRNICTLDLKREIFVIVINPAFSMIEN